MKSNQPTFKMNKHFLLYLDLLGYKQIFDMDEKIRIIYLETIHSIYYDFINNIVEKFNDFGLQLKFQMFSDNLVSAFEISEEESDDSIFEKLIALLLPISSLQIQLITHERLPMPIPVRGVITIGNLYIDEKYVTGEALVSAYQIENSKEVGIGALYPRIIIDKEVWNIYQDCMSKKDELSQKSQIILKDDDGLFFLNYLDHFESYYYFFKKTMNPEVRIKNLIRHKNSVGKCLTEYQSNDKTWLNVREKYDWMIRYHNSYCKKNNYTSFIVK